MFLLSPKRSFYTRFKMIRTWAVELSRLGNELIIDPELHPGTLERERVRRLVQNNMAWVSYSAWRLNITIPINVTFFRNFRKLTAKSTTKLGNPP